MESKNLKYELTQEEVNYLLTAINRVQFSGIQAAKSLLHVQNKLQNPLNIEELEKDQLEVLKEKYEIKK